MLLACTTPTLDSDTAPLPTIALPCPAGQTLTLPRMGALDHVALDGGQGGELEVEWTM